MKFVFGWKLCAENDSSHVSITLSKLVSHTLFSRIAANKNLNLSSFFAVHEFEKSRIGFVALSYVRVDVKSSHISSMFISIIFPPSLKVGSWASFQSQFNKFGNFQWYKLLPDMNRNIFLNRLYFRICGPLLDCRVDLFLWLWVLATWVPSSNCPMWRCGLSTSTSRVRMDPKSRGWNLFSAISPLPSNSQQFSSKCELLTNQPPTHKHAP